MPLAEGDFAAGIGDLRTRPFDRRFGIDELHAAGFDPGLVQAVAERVVRNQYKRLPPVIAKLSRRTIGSDFRYLRDWKR